MTRFIVEHFFRNPRLNFRREFNDRDDALECLTDYLGYPVWHATLKDQETGEMLLLPQDRQKIQHYIEDRFGS